MARHLLAAFFAGGICVIASDEAQAQAQMKLAPEARVVPRKVMVNPCDGSAILAAARAARDAVDPQAADASQRRSQVYRATFMQRVSTCLDERLSWAATATTGPTTWARAQGTLDGYFTELWRAGALFGARTSEAFFVRCDRTTMTQSDIDAGFLVCGYGLAMVRPADFDNGIVRLRTSGTDPASAPLPALDASAERAALKECASKAEPPSTIATIAAQEATYTTVLTCRLAWAQREPSSARTWALLERQIGFFLSTEQSAGRIAQGTATTTFARCDAQTMTRADIEANRKVCAVGFVPRVGKAVVDAEPRILRVAVSPPESSKPAPR